VPGSVYVGNREKSNVLMQWETTCFVLRQYMIFLPAKAKDASCSLDLTAVRRYSQQRKRCYFELIDQMLMSFDSEGLRRSLVSQYPQAKARTLDARTNFADIRACRPGFAK
jgi:hypothetical protein